MASRVNPVTHVNVAPRRDPENDYAGVIERVDHADPAVAWVTDLRKGLIAFYRRVDSAKPGDLIIVAFRDALHRKTRVCTVERVQHAFPGLSGREAVLVVRSERGEPDEICTSDVRAMFLIKSIL